MLLPTGRLLAVAVLLFGAIQGQTRPKKSLLKPYRVLVVVAAWGDPASQVISEHDAFQPVADDRKPGREQSLHTWMECRGAQALISQGRHPV